MANFQQATSAHERGLPDSILSAETQARQREVIRQQNKFEDISLGVIPSDTQSTAPGFSAVVKDTFIEKFQGWAADLGGLEAWLTNEQMKNGALPRIQRFEDKGVSRIRLDLGGFAITGEMIQVYPIAQFDQDGKLSHDHEEGNPGSVSLPGALVHQIFGNSDEIYINREWDGAILTPVVGISQQG